MAKPIFYFVVSNDGEHFDGERLCPFDLIEEKDLATTKKLARKQGRSLEIIPFFEQKEDDYVTRTLLNHLIQIRKLEDVLQLEFEQRTSELILRAFARGWDYRKSRK